MEQTTVVGIDVSKDRLDVHVLPSQEAWAAPRDAEGGREHHTALREFSRARRRLRSVKEVSSGRPASRTIWATAASVSCSVQSAAVKITTWSVVTSLISMAYLLVSSRIAVQRQEQRAVPRRAASY